MGEDVVQLALSLLGGFRATLAGQPVTVRTKKARALLALLAVEAGHFHPRETLAGLLWPDQPNQTDKQWRTGRIAAGAAALRSASRRAADTRPAEKGPNTVGP